MKLVIGGNYQGKKEAACRLFGLDMSDFADGKTCAFADIFTCRAISDFQEFIRRYMLAAEREQNPTESPETAAERKQNPTENPAARREQTLPGMLSQQLAERNPQICIVSNEIGYGVVPIDAQEREWRELTGRICCRIAEASDTVVRVAAGIPMVIKGSTE